MAALIVPFLILAVMWVLVILPQQRRAKAHQRYVDSLSLGDDVVTTAGLYGTIVALDDQTAKLRVAPRLIITIARLAIAHPQPSEQPDEDDELVEPSGAGVESADASDDDASSNDD